jgi:homoserine O-acetyltransferase
VGLVTPQKFQFEQPLELECGRILPRFDLMVETYGTLNADKSNAILICHALSGHHHAAGYHHEMIKKQVGGIAVLVLEKRLIPIIFLSFL